MDLTRRRFLVLSGGAAAGGLLLGRPHVPQALAAGVPTWESMYGYALGSRQATAEEIDTYLVALARASDRVQTQTLRPLTVKGSVLRYALVSTPENLERVPQLSRKVRALRLKPPQASVAAAYAAREPAFVQLMANVHGNEPSGSDALVKLLYNLAAGEDEETARRLRNCVFVVLPVQNPDGRNASRRVNANGFDLNRDWFAFTQPETVGKLGLYADYTPIVGLDEHEQFLSAPDTFFFPPDNDPVHHEHSPSGLAASDRFLTPAMEKAFTAKGYTWEHYGLYDHYYPGYGDVSPNQIWGAAGLIFEQENNEIYARKVDRQFTATDALVGATAANKTAMFQAWAAQWPAVKADGAKGRLQPNVRHNPANPEPRKVPGDRIYGYALRTTTRAADVAHLVDRLRKADVEVHVLRRAVTVRRLRRFGETTWGRATLGRGTVIITAAQPMKRWVHILLADQPYPSNPYFYDVAGWSNPALMALDGGAIGESLTPLVRRPKRTKKQLAAQRRPRAATLKAVSRGSDLLGHVGRSGAYRFALDAAHAQAAAFALIKDGVTLTPEVRTGYAVTGAKNLPKLQAAAKRYGIRLMPAGDTISEAAALRRPKVALMHDLGADVTEILFASSPGFALWLLRDRFGLDVTRVTTSDVDGGILASGGFDVLVVPDGLATVIPGGGQIAPNVSLALPNGGLTPLGLTNIQMFVNGGGTFIGYRNQGVAVAKAAGIAGDLDTKAAPSGFVVPGGPVQIDLVSEDLAVKGIGPRAFAFNVTDPILKGGGTTIARYPATLNALFYNEGLEAVNGSVAGTMVASGKGRAYVFSFDPAYRGFVEGVQAIVGNILLRPAPPAAAPPARGVDLLAAARLQAPVRHHHVRVAPQHAGALRDALTAIAGKLPDVLHVEPLQVRAPDLDPLSGHPAHWVRSLIGELVARGAAPELIVA